MPTGPGLFFAKEGNIFKIKPMLQSGKQASRQSLEWLEFQQARCPYPNATIKHAFNYGEQKVAGYYVDGLIEIPNSADGSIFRVAYDFAGCYYHYCPWQCQKKCLATIEDGRKDEQRLYQIEQAVDHLIRIRGCEWEEQRELWLGRFEAANFCFISENKVTEEKIIQKIQEKKFYGLVRADIRTPPDVIEEYEHLNFPFIFRKCEITEEMLSPRMQRLAKEGKKTFPKVTRTLTWNAQDIILTTTMIEFYLGLGIQVSNIRWAIQYYPSKPFADFVQGMVDVRINALKSNNKPLGERAKFCLNSCVGRFG